MGYYTGKIPPLNPHRRKMPPSRPDTGSDQEIGFVFPPDGRSWPKNGINWLCFAFFLRSDRAVLGSGSNPECCISGWPAANGPAARSQPELALFFRETAVFGPKTRQIGFVSQKRLRHTRPHPTWTLPGHFPDLSPLVFARP